MRSLGNACTLFDMEGKVLGKTSSYSVNTIRDLGEGNTIFVGAKEVEVH